MKKYIVLVFLIFSVLPGKAQDTVHYKNYYFKDFNWAINIPTFLAPVSEGDWAKLEGENADDLKNSNGNSVNVIKPKFICFFRRPNKIDSFESSSMYIGSRQAYLRENYNTQLASCKNYAKISPKIKIDTLSKKVDINNLSFDLFVLKLTNTETNYIIGTSYTFTRMFGNRELSIDVLFEDDKNGGIILNSFKNSTFGKLDSK